MNSKSKLSELITKATTCNFAGNYDNAGRWYPSDAIASDYCRSYRTPSRAWPYSYLNALSTITANVELKVITPEQAKIVRSARRLHMKLIAAETSPAQKDIIAEKLRDLEAKLT